ncbi:MAG TPA: HD domain-containing protein [Lachnospiraceae bacterium]|nr:HD domain-containing protein [Lachnospiraceae bacterium]
MTRLEQQMNFILEVDKLKNVTRQTYVSSGDRKENDTEHSWHLALMAALLCEHSNEPIDVTKTMIMVLIHDIVEIDAGDTYAYDEVGNLSKRERELAAAERIFNLLPKDQAVYLRNLWDEFEEGKSAEAKFALTLDKVQPTMLNDYSDGKAWREHGVHIDQILKRNESTPEGSKELWDFSKALIDKNVELGNIKK